jgi:hypothetical protein
MKPRDRQPASEYNGRAEILPSVERREHVLRAADHFAEQARRSAQLEHEQHERPVIALDTPPISDTAPKTEEKLATVTEINKDRAPAPAEVMETTVESAAMLAGSRALVAEALNIPVEAETEESSDGGLADVA